MYRKRKNNLITTLVILITFILFFFFSIGYSVLKQTLTISGNASTLGNQMSDDVSFTVDSWFDGNLYYYKVSMTVTNRNSLPFISWNISMDVPNDANLQNHSGITAYILDSRIMCNNTSYNGNVAPNGSVNFEFQISTSLSEYIPTNIIFNGNLEDTPLPPEEEENPDSNDIDINFTVTNSWKSGGFNYYQYDVTIANNNTNLSTKSWQFDITLPKHTNVNQSWNTNLTQVSDTQITFYNYDYNGIIPPNSNIVFGLIIETKTKNFIPEPINIVIK